MSQLTILNIVTLLHFTSWHLYPPMCLWLKSCAGGHIGPHGGLCYLPTIFAIPTGIICDFTGRAKDLSSAIIGIAVTACILLVSTSIGFLVAISVWACFNVLQSVATQVIIGDTAPCANVLYLALLPFIVFYACVGILLAALLEAGGKDTMVNIHYLFCQRYDHFMAPFSFLVRERNRSNRSHNKANWAITGAGIRDPVRQPRISSA